MKFIIVLTLSLVIVLPSFAQDYIKQQECVVEKGYIKTVNVDYDRNTGERSLMVNGTRKKLADLYPETGPDYAAGQAWYISGEAIPFQNKSYIKYGLPRVVGVTDVVKIGAHKGLSVFAEPGQKADVPVIYIPVRQGCEFQPYTIDCGRVKIQKVKATATTMDFTATVTGVTGNIRYAWTTYKINIIKGQGTSTITVDSKDKKNKDTFVVEVKVNEGTSCPTGANQVFVVTGQND